MCIGLGLLVYSPINGGGGGGRHGPFMPPPLATSVFVSIN